MVTKAERQELRERARAASSAWHAINLDDADKVVTLQLTFKQLRDLGFVLTRAMDITNRVSDWVFWMEEDACKELEELTALLGEMKAHSDGDR